jgi:uncharacterized protein (TIGR02594 family)
LEFALLEEELGVSEIKGPEQHNSRILLYHDTTILDASTDEVPWCSSFVNWCVKECGLLLEGTNSARARSWLEWGTPLLIPPVGAVTILKRGGNGQPGPTVIDAKGHVGFFLGQTNTHVELVGGNQSDRVLIKKYPISRVLGHRWPL